LLLEKGRCKTIASLSHRTIVLVDIIDYRTVEFVRYRPNFCGND